MKIEYIKDWTGHSKGDVIDTDFLTARWMVEKGICSYFGEQKTQEQSDKVYTDSTGKTYTEEEVSKMDKRTNLYKELTK